MPIVFLFGGRGSVVHTGAKMLVQALLTINAMRAQIALPYRMQGQYLIGDEKSTIQVESFVDPFCGDARSEYFMWKGLKAKLNPGDVGVSFKIIVEPFHPWSFTASVGAYTCAAFGGSDAFFSYAEAMWVNAGDFVTQWGSDSYALQNLTEATAVAKMAGFAETAAGVSQADFYHGMTNRSTGGGTNPWGVAREMWKQAVARGAASSPWYYVNGVPFFAACDSQHQGEDGWTDLLDKLLAKQRQ